MLSSIHFKKPNNCFLQAQFLKMYFKNPYTNHKQLDMSSWKFIGQWFLRLKFNVSLF